MSAVLLVKVGLPVFNSERFVSRSLESLLNGIIISSAFFVRAKWERQNRRFVTFLGYGMLTFGLIGCGGSGGSADGGSTPSPGVSITVNSVSLTPLVASTQVGQTQQYTATARDVNGNVVPNVIVTWMSDNLAVASINSAGLASGLAPGTAAITASAEGVTSAGVQLQVTQSTVNSISLTPSVASIQASKTQQYTATARDMNGTVVPNLIFTWVSDNLAVASINSAGLASGLAPGTAAITASAGGATSPGAQLAVTTGGSGRKSYSTIFNYTENPLSDGGNWINGKATGRDWLDVNVTPGFAHANPITASETDPTAVLAGVWAPNQTAQARIVVNTIPAGIDEIELRLNTTITADSITGYELDFQTSGLVTIVRWEGAIGIYTIIQAAAGLPGGVLKTDDVLKATNVNGLITCYVNGVQVAQVTDTTYIDGSPGIGFYYSGSGAGPTDHGMSAFSATD